MASLPVLPATAAPAALLEGAQPGVDRDLFGRALQRAVADDARHDPPSPTQRPDRPDRPAASSAHVDDRPARPGSEDRPAADRDVHAADDRADQPQRPEGSDGPSRPDRATPASHRVDREPGDAAAAPGADAHGEQGSTNGDAANSVASEHSRASLHLADAALEQLLDRLAHPLHDSLAALVADSVSTEVETEVEVATDATGEAVDEAGSSVAGEPTDGHALAVPADTGTTDLVGDLAEQLAASMAEAATDTSAHTPTDMGAEEGATTTTPSPSTGDGPRDGADPAAVAVIAAGVTAVDATASSATPVEDPAPHEPQPPVPSDGTTASPVADVAGEAMLAAEDVAPSTSTAASLTGQTTAPAPQQPADGAAGGRPAATPAVDHAAPQAVQHAAAAAAVHAEPDVPANQAAVPAAQAARDHAATVSRLAGDGTDPTVVPTGAATPSTAAAPATPAVAPASAAQGSAVVERVLQIVRALENQPPPRQVTVELGGRDGLRLDVRVTASGVHVVAHGSAEAIQPVANLGRDLAAALADRGLELGEFATRQDGDDGRGQPAHEDQPAPPRPATDRQARQPADDALRL